MIDWRDLDIRIHDDSRRRAREMGLTDHGVESFGDVIERAMRATVMEIKRRNDVAGPLTRMRWDFAEIPPTWDKEGLAQYRLSRELKGQAGMIALVLFAVFAFGWMIGFATAAGCSR